MLFNSFKFLIFFPLVITAYFILPHRLRWLLLLLASYFFYMAWKPAYVILILLSTCVDYFACIMMEKQGEQKKRRKFLILSLVVNLGLLFIFKYFNFFNASFGAIVEYLGKTYSIPDFSLLLPIGISFYTFQTLSYTIDVYHGRIKAEHHFGIFALYVSFFPQLVAGPIERAGRLLPQFYKKQVFDYQRLTSGLRLMAWGMFKKIVIADRIAIAVNNVYGNPSGYEGPALILATILFAFQIFCDFSGYSDIAIGAARVMGFNLMQNFKRPYFSKSISEFWHRWHISLSTWFKDYLYIPLGGNRVSVPRWYINLLITFVISGLWHGANWTFFLWGLLHGVYLVIGYVFKPIKQTIVSFTHLDKLPLIHRFIQIVITFSMVCFAWIFFRANNVNDAFYIISHLFDASANVLSYQYLKETLVAMGIIVLDMQIAVGAILLMEIVHLIQRKHSITEILFKIPMPVRWAVYYIFVLSILIFGKMGVSEFIYFQF